MEAAVGQAVQRSRVEDRLFEWERMHETVGGTVTIRPETKAARKRRVCREHCRCVKHAAGRSLDMVCSGLRQYVVAAAGRQRKPKSAIRLLIEDCRIVLRFISVAGDSWHLLARMRWEPLQLTLLTMTRMADGKLGVGYRIPASDRFAPWHLDVEVAETLDLQQAWEAEMWQIETASMEAGSWRVGVQLVSGCCRSFVWQGASDLERASKYAEGSDGDSEADDADSDPALDVDNVDRNDARTVRCKSHTRVLCSVCIGTGACSSGSIIVNS